jgi:bifunctional non-homologous end joining protein LigD
MPSFVEPCDPTLQERLPATPGWIYEIKTASYRAQVHIRDGEVTVYSRSGYDWTEQFAALAEAATKLRVREAIIDGEATVLGKTGLPDFQALRRELANPQSKRLLYHAFDLLYLNGRDLRANSLLDRKHTLKSLLHKAPSTIMYVDYIEADGARVFAEACRMGLEGIIAKRTDAPYRSGRQDSWIKLKCVESGTFPIVAFVEKLGGHPRKIASLYVGRWDGDRLLYAGKARSGYTETVARELRERLNPLIRRTSPLAIPVKKPKATWVEPAVDAEIAYSAFTDDGLLRAAVFKGLRDDLRKPNQASLPRLPRQKSPSLVPDRGSNSRSIHGVPRENILQLLPDAVTPSKEELTACWKRVANRALAHLVRRPLKLVRRMHGVTFYHRGKLPEVPASVHQLGIQKREGSEGIRLWVDDLNGLLGLVAMDAVEVHPWNATIDDIERADRIVIDLDPGEAVEWASVVQTALMLREVLRAEGLEPWPKVTGGKGLHLMAPLQRGMLHDDARQYTRSLVQKLVEKWPHSYVLSASPAARHFLDYLRNGRGNTAIGAYSPRARPNFPIACPVSWSQVEKGISPDAFAMRHPSRRKPGVSNPQH